jgi:uncharacterized protein (DUF1684 family)
MAKPKFYILIVFIFCFAHVPAQRSYIDSLQKYLDSYVKDHEVVKGNDKKYFDFFPIDETYRVMANFQKAAGNKWFLVETSGRERKTFRVYGTVSFTIHDTLMKLNLYQAQNLLADPKYKDYLVLMFTDKTSGIETYESGRYIDLAMSGIKNNKIAIDFNKAYNPYCAYVKDKYNCPIPPRENGLPIVIRAGEKAFAKKIE